MARINNNASEWNLTKTEYNLGGWGKTSGNFEDSLSAVLQVNNNLVDQTTGAFDPLKIDALFLEIAEMLIPYIVERWPILNKVELKILDKITYSEIRFGAYNAIKNLLINVVDIITNPSSMSVAAFSKTIESNLTTLTQGRLGRDSLTRINNSGINNYSIEWNAEQQEYDIFYEDNSLNVAFGIIDADGKFISGGGQELRNVIYNSESQIKTWIAQSCSGLVEYGIVEYSFLPSIEEVNTDFNAGGLQILSGINLTPSNIEPSAYVFIKNTNASAEDQIDEYMAWWDANTQQWYEQDKRFKEWAITAIELLKIEDQRLELVKADKAQVEIDIKNNTTSADGVPYKEVNIKSLKDGITNPVYRGTYATLQDAEISLKNPNNGDLILVGLVSPWTMYIYNKSTFLWEDGGIYTSEYAIPVNLAEDQKLIPVAGVVPIGEIDLPIKIVIDVNTPDNYKLEHDGILMLRLGSGCDDDDAQYEIISSTKIKLLKEIEIDSGSTEYLNHEVININYGKIPSAEDIEVIVEELIILNNKVNSNTNFREGLKKTIANEAPIAIGQYTGSTKAGWSGRMYGFSVPNTAGNSINGFYIDTVQDNDTRMVNYGTGGYMTGANSFNISVIDAVMQDLDGGTLTTTIETDPRLNNRLWVPINSPSITNMVQLKYRTSSSSWIIENKGVLPIVDDFDKIQATIYTIDSTKLNETSIININPKNNALVQDTANYTAGAQFVITTLFDVETNKPISMTKQHFKDFGKDDSIVQWPAGVGKNGIEIILTPAQKALITEVSGKREVYAMMTLANSQDRLQFIGIKLYDWEANLHFETQEINAITYNETDKDFELQGGDTVKKAFNKISEFGIISDSNSDKEVGIKSKDNLESTSLFAQNKYGGSMAGTRVKKDGKDYVVGIRETVKGWNLWDKIKNKVFNIPLEREVWSGRTTLSANGYINITDLQDYRQVKVIFENPLDTNYMLSTQTFDVGGDGLISYIDYVAGVASFFNGYIKLDIGRSINTHLRVVSTEVWNNKTDTKASQQVAIRKVIGII